MHQMHPIFERTETQMSASREKKTRQDQVSSGWTDPKTAREAQQRKEQKERAAALRADQDKIAQEQRAEAARQKAAYQAKRAAQRAALKAYKQAQRTDQDF